MTNLLLQSGLGTFLKRCVAVMLACLAGGGVAFAAGSPAWETGIGHRRLPVTPEGRGGAGFVRLDGAETGIRFTNRLAQSRYTTNQIHLNGSGVAAGDVDGDGWCDLYFCGLDGPNVLYRNRGGWRFEDVTVSAGVACEGLDATAAALADLDGDGDLDLVVSSIGGGVLCFQNDGRGRFQPLPSAGPLNPARGGMSMALADIDGDGDLDLYVTNYRTSTIRDQPNTRIQGESIDGRLVVRSVNGRPVTEPDLIGRYTLEPGGKVVENGEPDVLFLNDGTGRFQPVRFTDGTFLDEDGRPFGLPLYDWGLSVMFRDLNGDRAPDIYVCNDFSAPDRVWINDGKGHYRAIPRLALRHTSLFSMGIDFADLNGDGHDDFFTADMLSRDYRRRQIQVGDVVPMVPVIGRIDDRPQYSRNMLFVGRGDGGFTEVGYYSGVQASEWSWTPVFLDVDLDGHEDLLITTGHERDAMNADVMRRAEMMKAARNLSPAELLELNNLFARLDVPNVAFRNRGDLTFEEQGSAWGFDSPGVSHGMALADLDNDGDMDLAVNNLNGPAGIYRNRSSAPRVLVRLKGRRPNTRAIGARIVVRGGPVLRQSQEVMAGGRYLSSDDAARTFAAGHATNLLNIEVIWRSGRRSLLAGVPSNRLYEIDEADSPPAPVPVTDDSRDAIRPWFEDVSGLLQHSHHEEAFDDFARQPLLPRKLSQLGPGVAWHDVDGDGWDDLLVASGRGGLPGVFRNESGHGFKRVAEAPINRPTARDQTAVVGLDSMVMMGMSNHEDGLTNGGCIRIYDLQRRVSGDSILGQGFSAGPLALADTDGDGDLDLFVGGRSMPGRYPEPATSLLMRNDRGRLVPQQRFERLGLVSGAVFSDLDGDGTPELVLACDWGAIRVLRVRDGQYVEAGNELGLSSFQGWWNGVTTGDFDGDGRLDIVASNWGLNSRYQASPEQPRRLRFGDLAGRGMVDIIETLPEPVSGREVFDRGLKTLTAALPFLTERNLAYDGFSRMSVQDLLGDALKAASVHQATTLATTVFLNRGGRFEARPLPPEAQWSPCFAVVAGDADGDGNEDVFLGQNFFAVHPELSRHDAGRGLWLRGDGTGRFVAVSSQASGVSIEGEQRGAAMGDYDGDGRPDLVVAQNGAATRLFRNVAGRPGLRVRLRGPAQNTRGIGASIRLVYPQGEGPVRELHAGSGYWSQDSAVAVLGKRAEPTQVWVRWPGGRVTQSPVPPGASEVVIDAEGGLSVVRPKVP